MSTPYRKSEASNDDVILDVRDLSVDFSAPDKEPLLRAVNELSFSLRAGRTTGLVGESGCGKSVTALALMGLVDRPGRVSHGQIVYRGEDLLAVDEARMRQLRGNKISMIFQEPMTSLNPVYTAGEQIAESLRWHRSEDRRGAEKSAVALLGRVGIPDPELRARAYPHELSGGMRQRVMIAMALACDPDILIADEPTTALDVTIQAQILDLLAALQEDTKMSILFITHDLGVVAESCDEMLVMYAGRAVEAGPASDVLASPSHPYTQGLMRSLPNAASFGGRLQEIPGSVPPLGERGAGCPFANRCERAVAQCREEMPSVTESADRMLRCFHPSSSTAAVQESPVGDSA